MSKSLFQKFSLAYKTTRFPWKKHALIGYDLKGNEYWDCPNPLGIFFFIEKAVEANMPPQD